VPFGDYARLARRAFDDPYDPELAESLLVCADALGQAGDPRGALITMEYALRDADRRRALELRRAIHEHVVEHQATLIGDEAAWLLESRLLALEWRAGMIYGASLDLRHVTTSKASEAVTAVLTLPTSLRRLRVRIRKEGHVEPIVGLLRPAVSLQELEIGQRVWPERITARSSLLLATHPNLYFLALGDQIHALPVEEADGTDPQVAWVMLGRALTSSDPDQRAAAYARVAALGVAAATYERVLGILLQPRVTTDQRAIADALGALGTRTAVTILSKVASRGSQYDRETRSAAGKAVARAGRLATGS
jgi:hypothetical protein